MALDSFLYLAAEIAPADIEAVLLRDLAFQPAEAFRTVLRVSADSTLLSIFRNSERARSWEEAGIAGKICVLSSCIDKERAGAWSFYTIRAVMNVLRAFETDALYTHAPDHPALMRKDGVITLDPRCGLWANDVRPPLLPLIDPEHRYGLIPIS